MLTMVGAIATFEREMMLERQTEGIAIAKQIGKYTGRKPTAREKAPQAMELLGQWITYEFIADQLGIGIASVYRVIKEQKAF